MRSLASLALAAIALLWLSGCANNTQPAAGREGGDLVTESDESPTLKRAKIRLELALGYFEQGKTTIALDEIKQALAVEPSYFDAFNLRGLIYMRLNDPDLAQDSFQRALALRPKDPNVLHNMGWLKCQQAAYAESQDYFSRALASPNYTGKAKTWMTQGLCQLKAVHLADAERSLLRSYELDPGNPIVGYNLAHILVDRKDFVRAQFYIRRINNSELANAESLWLGIKTERALGQFESSRQLATQLEKRFSQSSQAQALRRGAFDE
jgi:type IV pilus assembly protein PilF